MAAGASTQGSCGWSSGQHNCSNSRAPHRAWCERTYVLHLHAEAPRRRWEAVPAFHEAVKHKSWAWCQTRIQQLADAVAQRPVTDICRRAR